MCGARGRGGAPRTKMHRGRRVCEPILQGRPPSPSSASRPHVLPPPRPPPRGAAALSDTGLALPAHSHIRLARATPFGGEQGWSGEARAPFLQVWLQWPRLFCSDASAGVCRPQCEGSQAPSCNLGPHFALGEMGPCLYGARSAPGQLPSAARGFWKMCPLRRGVKSVWDSSQLCAPAPGHPGWRDCLETVWRGGSRGQWLVTRAPSPRPPSECLPGIASPARASDQVPGAP